MSIVTFDPNGCEQYPNTALVESFLHHTGTCITRTLHLAH